MVGSRVHFDVDYYYNVVVSLFGEVYKIICSNPYVMKSFYVNEPKFNE